MRTRSLPILSSIPKVPTERQKIPSQRGDHQTGRAGWLKSEAGGREKAGHDVISFSPLRDKKAGLVVNLKPAPPPEFGLAMMSCNDDPGQGWVLMLVHTCRQSSGQEKINGSDTHAGCDTSRSDEAITDRQRPCNYWPPRAVTLESRPIWISYSEFIISTIYTKRLSSTTPGYPEMLPLSRM